MLFVQREGSRLSSFLASTPACCQSPRLGEMRGLRVRPGAGHPRSPALHKLLRPPPPSLSFRIWKMGIRITGSTFFRGPLRIKCVRSLKQCRTPFSPLFFRRINGLSRIHLYPSVSVSASPYVRPQTPPRLSPGPPERGGGCSPHSGFYCSGDTEAVPQIAC